MDNREQQASKAVMFCELLPSINIVFMSLLKRRRAVSLTFHSRENKQHTRFSPNAYMYEEKKRYEIACMPKGVYARVYPFFVNFIWFSMMSLWEWHVHSSVLKDNFVWFSMMSLWEWHVHSSVVKDYFNSCIWHLLLFRVWSNIYNINQETDENKEIYELGYHYLVQDQMQ